MDGRCRDLPVSSPGKIIEAPLQHVDYDMSKYDWNQIADEVGGVYQGLKK